MGNGGKTETRNNIETHTRIQATIPNKRVLTFLWRYSPAASLFPVALLRPDLILRPQSRPHWNNYWYVVRAHLFFFSKQKSSIQLWIDGEKTTHTMRLEKCQDTKRGRPIRSVRKKVRRVTGPYSIMHFVLLYSKFSM